MRPFRILGLQQVAIGHSSKRALRALWFDLLGLESAGEFRSRAENVDEDIVLLGKGRWRIELDLMTPLDPAGRPRVHQPALNHIGLWVDDLDSAVAWLREHGVRFTPGGIRRGASGHDVAFIHPQPDLSSPRSGEGVLIELVQAPPELIELYAAHR